MTCNDFSLEGSWHENVWAPLLYILMIAKEQCVTACHWCPCDIIKMLIWQHTNYDPDESTPEKNLTLPLSLTWPFTMILRYFDGRPLLCCPVFLFFSTQLRPLCIYPKVNPIGWMFCHGSLWMFLLCCCYLLAADRAMNSGAKWNSYCYQKHKIPITLGVRAGTRKWNRYS